MPPKGSTGEPKYRPPCATSEEAQTLLAGVQGEYTWDRQRTSDELATLFRLKRQLAVARGTTNDGLPAMEAFVDFMQLVEKTWIERDDTPTLPDLKKKMLSFQEGIVFKDSHWTNHVF